MRLASRALPILGALLVAGCSSAANHAAAGDSAAGAPASASPIAGGPGTRPVSEPSHRRDQPIADADTGERATLARLEREARALASTSGCRSAGDCRSAPVGARACGGPRSYLTYCAATTDTVALFARLQALETAEQAYNRHSGMMSTCEMRLPPATALVGGRCTEAR